MKRLYRSRKNRVIAGICGGIGEYLDIDPVIIRILVAVFFAATWIPYLIAWTIVPEQP